jgi:hypothetical protein
MVRFLGIKLLKHLTGNRGIFLGSSGGDGDGGPFTNKLWDDTSVWDDSSTFTD